MIEYKVTRNVVCMYIQRAKLSGHKAKSENKYSEKSTQETSECLLDQFCSIFVSKEYASVIIIWLQMVNLYNFMIQGLDINWLVILITGWFFEIEKCLGNSGIWGSGFM